MIVHGGLPNLRNTLSSQLLLCFCGALLLSLVFFMAGFEVASSCVSDACRGIGALLHFAILSSFAWTVVQAIHLRSVVAAVRGLQPDRPDRLRLYNLLAWGEWNVTSVCRYMHVVADRSKILSWSRIVLVVV